LKAKEAHRAKDNNSKKKRPTTQGTGGSRMSAGQDNNWIKGLGEEAGIWATRLGKGMRHVIGVAWSLLWLEERITGRANKGERDWRGLANGQKEWVSAEDQQIGGLRVRVEGMGRQWGRHWGRNGRSPNSQAHVTLEYENVCYHCTGDHEGWEGWGRGAGREGCDQGGAHVTMSAF
jgi:hypothetical protein